MTDKYFGSHEIRQRDEVVKTSTDRNFGLVFAVLFGIVGGLSFYNGRSHWLWWLALAAFLAAVSHARPQLLAPFNRLWTRFRASSFRGREPDRACSRVLSLYSSDRMDFAADRQGSAAPAVRG